MTEATRPRCPACGGEDFKEGFPAEDAAFRVLRCGACGLGLTWPAPSDDEIREYYPESYYGRENVRFNRVFEAMTRFFQRRRSRVLRRRAPRGAVLDVGCGRGYLLKYLQDSGYEARGLELSEQAAWHARHRLGLDVQTGDFRSADLPESHFNAVVFWHTLEHFRRPDEVLRRAARLLKPGGIMAVAVPNSESLQAGLFGRHWFHLDVPRHYAHFGESSLRRLLEANGLRVIRLDHFCFEQNPYGWLQSLYNAAGFEHNLLYDALKSRSARTRRLHDKPLQLLAMAALLPAFLTLSIAMTLVEAALRRGGTIEVYAVKRPAS